MRAPARQSLLFFPLLVTGTVSSLTLTADCHTLARLDLLTLPSLPISLNTSPRAPAPRPLGNQDEGSRKYTSVHYTTQWTTNKREKISIVLFYAHFITILAVRRADVVAGPPIAASHMSTMQRI